ncbi:uncharacterized protein METZ01_LOCUS208461, partial [marine metagenome]
RLEYCHCIDKLFSIHRCSSRIDYPL